MGISFKKAFIALISINIFLAFYPQTTPNEDLQTETVSSREFLQERVIESKSEWDVWEYMSQHAKWDKAHLGLRKNSNYCREVEQYNQQHSLTGRIRERRVFTEYKFGLLVRQVIRNHFVDAHPKVRIHLTEAEKAALNQPLDPRISVFFTKNEVWHHLFKIGEDVVCEHQRYNHIPGAEHFCNKDWLVMNFKDYENHEDYLKEEPHSEVSFIKKASRGLHNGKGIAILDDAGIKGVIKEYDGGKKCGVRTKPIQIQFYVHSYLVNKHKFDFRVYMLIANVRPTIAFFHDGFLRFAMKEYKEGSTELGSNITNTQLAKTTKFGEDPGDYTTLDQQMWNFTQFEEHMEGNGLAPRGWFKNDFKKQMKRIMAHLIRMSVDKYLNHPGLFELFGCDFVLDSNLKVYFIEANNSPAFQATTEEKGRIQSQLIKEALDMQFAILENGINTDFTNKQFEMIIDERIDDLDDTSVFWMINATLKVVSKK
eukprot:CAMPEP_0115037216 /NCGR_PEP_ID=MMETSP0216-20121206/42646_1 /TAXON_ID=223996 /ORGANISM="Protocruzia adherens, Strain Boccale" /LENGTH=481 /DNA_ID=CAMNT_0002417313 /DNA_START=22 /DNA_END=1467 /DNA_ORIENTATION=+